MKLLLPIAVLIASGCSGGFSHRSALQGSQNILRATITANPPTLDPAVIQDVVATPIIQNVFEGLVQWNASNALAPRLAESWDVSNGGRTYTFHLRKGVKFHNGREMAADDVKYSLERALDPSLNSPTAANYLGDIVGAKDRLARRAPSVSGIEVVDRTTVKITIDKPRAYFLGKLTYPCAFIVAKEGAPMGKEISSAASMIGTGPFKAQAFVPEQEMSLTAFEDYWGGKPRLSGFREIVMKDSQTRLNKFLSGEMEIADITRQDAIALKKDPAHARELRFLTSPAVAYLAMNPNGYPPFADARIRRAIAMAVDRRQIVDELLGGINQPAEGILPPGIAGHREHPAGIPYDPAGGAKLLAQTGHPGGKGLPPLELVIRDQTPDSRLIGEAVASQINKNLGWPVSVKTMEFRTLLETRNKNKLGFFFLSWYADYLDPQNFLSTLFATTSPQNHYGYSNPTVDRLCDEADTSFDPKKRIELYQKAEDIVLQDAPWIPLYFVRDAELVSPRVLGMHDNLMGHLPYTQVELK